MVNIGRFIRREKERFRSFRTRIETERIKTETARLEAEKKRQGDLARINARKQIAQRDVDQIKAYNEKVRGPSKLKRFGQGAAKAMDKIKETKASRDKAGKGLRFGVPGRTEGSRGFGMEVKSDPFAPKNKSPFNK